MDTEHILRHHLFARKSTTICTGNSLGQVTTGGTARLTGALTAALKVLNVYINWSKYM